MIGLLRGPVVLRTGEGEVIIDVAGVGYRVTVTPATAAALLTGSAPEPVTLYVHTHVREDAIVLYGFAHDDERRCFEVLLGSHGVGPALALAIMAVLSPAALSTAVLEDDLETLCSVPGVGRKTAARLLIELKSRLDLPDLSVDMVGASVGGSGDGARGVPARQGWRVWRRAGPPIRGAGCAQRARLRPRRDPRRAGRPTRRCRRGGDASPGAARAGRPVSGADRARREVLAVAADDIDGRGEFEGEDVAPGRVVDPAPSNAEEELEEVGLRPRSLAEFIGQPELVEHLGIVLQAARQRRQPVDHILFAGPPGLGKTSLAGIVAAEMGAGFRITAGPVLTRGGDLAALLTDLQDGDILFIDEIHRLHHSVEEMLYSAMEDGRLDILIGKGPTARSIRLELPKFTLVGATTRTGLVSGPLRDRFGFVGRLDLYQPTDLRAIVERSARILKVEIDAEGASRIAQRSRGTPRVANRLLRRVRDYAEVRGEGFIDGATAGDGLELFGVDELGLDKVDRAILTTLCDRFAGQPVGLTTLSQCVGEEPDTIEDAYEPFLLQSGLIQRTARGRVATRRAWAHLGYEVPEPATAPSRQALLRCSEIGLGSDSEFVRRPAGRSAHDAWCALGPCVLSPRARTVRYRCGRCSPRPKRGDPMAGTKSSTQLISRAPSWTCRRSSVQPEGGSAWPGPTAAPPATDAGTAPAGPPAPRLSARPHPTVAVRLHLASRRPARRGESRSCRIHPSDFLQSTSHQEIPMGERTLFPNASTKATLDYCWRQMWPDRFAFGASAAAIVLGTLANAVAAPLIFATLLGRIANLGPGHGLWQAFGPLIVAYAVVLLAALVFGRIGGWLNWGATLRSFGRAITNGYEHLIGLSHGWHTDRPSGEVIATLETSTWAFVELIDAMVWGILRISVTTLGAVVVLGVVAWPVALVMLGLVGVFVFVLTRRMGRVVAAEKQFSDAHSRATGVIADTIANLTTVRTQAAEHREMGHVGALVGDSLSADFGRGASSR